MQRQKLIVVELPFEPLASKNSYKTRGGRFIRSRVRRWMRDCGAAVKAAMLEAGISSWQPPLRIEVDWYFPQHRGQREDPSNWYPALLDGIKGVLVDDAHIRLTDGRVERVATADAKIVLTISEEPSARFYCFREGAR